LAHLNVTSARNGQLQQLRQVVGDTGNHKYLIHDRDAMFAKHLDSSIRAMGLEVLRSPICSPKANATCERLIGTIRRECLDWIIPMSEAHLRSILRVWSAPADGISAEHKPTELPKAVGSILSSRAKSVTFISAQV
jgi:hypothetical protein